MFRRVQLFIAIFIVVAVSICEIQCVHSWIIVSPTSTLSSRIVQERQEQALSIKTLKQRSSNNSRNTLISKTITTGTTTTTALQMGIFRSMKNFLSRRKGDFIKLEKSGTEYGPGPALLLYHVPNGIWDEEIIDMISDGAPKASSKGVTIQRLDSVTTNSILDQDVQNALQTIITNNTKKDRHDEDEEPYVMDSDTKVLTKIDELCPVLFFSGFTNEEMMNTYNIIGEEIYQETGGRLTAACAKAVPNAMKKSLRQVLEEISGDHLEAVRYEDDDNDNTKN